MWSALYVGGARWTACSYSGRSYEEPACPGLPDAGSSLQHWVSPSSAMGGKAGVVEAS
jgi:hypothetical protein